MRPLTRRSSHEIYGTSDEEEEEDKKEQTPSYRERSSHAIYGSNEEEEGAGVQGETDMMCQPRNRGLTPEPFVRHYSPGWSSPTQAHHVADSLELLARRCHHIDAISQEGGSDGSSSFEGGDANDSQASESNSITRSGSCAGAPLDDQALLHVDREEVEQEDDDVPDGSRDAESEDCGSFEDEDEDGGDDDEQSDLTLSAQGSHEVTRPTRERSRHDRDSIPAIHAATSSSLPTQDDQQIYVGKAIATERGDDGNNEEEEGGEDEGDDDDDDNDNGIVDENDDDGKDKEEEEEDEDEEERSDREVDASSNEEDSFDEEDITEEVKSTSKLAAQCAANEDSQGVARVEGTHGDVNDALRQNIEALQVSSLADKRGPVHPELERKECSSTNGTPLSSPNHHMVEEREDLPRVSYAPELVTLRIPSPWEVGSDRDSVPDDDSIASSSEEEEHEPQPRRGAVGRFLANVTGFLLSGHAPPSDIPSELSGEAGKRSSEESSWGEIDDELSSSLDGDVEEGDRECEGVHGVGHRRQALSETGADIGKRSSEDSPWGDVEDDVLGISDDDEDRANSVHNARTAMRVGLSKDIDKRRSSWGVVEDELSSSLADEDEEDRSIEGEEAELGVAGEIDGEDVAATNTNLDNVALLSTEGVATCEEAQRGRHFNEECEETSIFTGSAIMVDRTSPLSPELVSAPGDLVDLTQPATSLGVVSIPYELSSPSRSLPRQCDRLTSNPAMVRSPALASSPVRLLSPQTNRGDHTRPGASPFAGVEPELEALYDNNTSGSDGEYQIPHSFTRGGILRRGLLQLYQGGMSIFAARPFDDQGADGNKVQRGPCDNKEDDEHTIQSEGNALAMDATALASVLVSKEEPNLSGDESDGSEHASSELRESTTSPGRPRGLAAPSVVLAETSMEEGDISDDGSEENGHSRSDTGDVALSPGRPRGLAATQSLAELAVEKESVSDHESGDSVDSTSEQTESISSPGRPRGLAAPKMMVVEPLMEDISIDESDGSEDSTSDVREDTIMPGRSGSLAAAQGAFAELVAEEGSSSDNESEASGNSTSELREEVVLAGRQRGLAAPNVILAELAAQLKTNDDDDNDEAKEALAIVSPSILSSQIPTETASIALDASPHSVEVHASDFQTSTTDLSDHDCESTVVETPEVTEVEEEVESNSSNDIRTQDISITPSSFDGSEDRSVTACAAETPAAGSYPAGIDSQGERQLHVLEEMVAAIEGGFATAAVASPIRARNIMVQTSPARVVASPSPITPKPFVDSIPFFTSNQVAIPAWLPDNDRRFASSPSSIPPAEGMLRAIGSGCERERVADQTTGAATFGASAYDTAFESQRAHSPPVVIRDIRTLTTYDADHSSVGSYQEDEELFGGGFGMTSPIISRRRRLPSDRHRFRLSPSTMEASLDESHDTDIFQAWDYGTANDASPERPMGGRALEGHPIVCMAPVMEVAAGQDMTSELMDVLPNDSICSQGSSDEEGEDWQDDVVTHPVQGDQPGMDTATLVADDAAIIIQRNVRGWQTRLACQVAIKSIVLIQSVMRRFIAKLKVSRLEVALIVERCRESAAITIQRYARGHIARYGCGRLQAEAVKKHRRHLSATTIQRYARGSRDRNRYQHLCVSTTRAQGAVRMWLARRTVDKRRAVVKHQVQKRKKHAALVIQAVYRGHISRRRSYELRVERRHRQSCDAAKLLQRVGRGYIVRREHRNAKELLEKHRSTVRIQAWVRCNLVRGAYRDIHTSACRIQAWYRYNRRRIWGEGAVGPVDVILQWTRVYKSRQKYAVVVRSFRVLQSRFRQRRIERITRIQALWRGVLTRLRLRREAEAAKAEQVRI